MSRGRGRGRGGGGAGFQMPDHSTLNRKEWMDALREVPKHSGMLYPPLDPEKEIAVLQAPTEREEAIMDKTTEMYQILTNGMPLGDGTRGGTPWRIQSERKVVGIEIETYSGRMRERQNLDGAGPSKGSGNLDPASLYLNKAYFPPSLWSDLFETQKQESGKRKEEAKEPVKKKIKRIDSDGEEDVKPSIEQEASPAPSSEQDEEFDFEDESDHQDYDANYFDNGEGDDDSGGDEEEGGGFDD